MFLEIFHKPFKKFYFITFEKKKLYFYRIPNQVIAYVVS